MKHIFIASVGGAPQVVTETLWALMHPHKMLSAESQARDPVVPDEIIMLTTAFKGLGATFSSKKKRLDVTRAKINALYRQYEHQLPKINSNRAQVVRSGDGKELEDIRNAEENAAFADAVVAVMTDLQQRRKKEALTLHVSLAGGRKTMSSYLYWGIINFGTEYDELTHVLVENHFLESAADFWWPNQEKKTVYSYAAKQNLSTDAQMDASGNLGDAARLDLVRVPFDPLKRTIPDIASRFANFTDLVAYQEWERNGGPIVFHLASHALNVAGKRITLTRSSFAILSTFATAAIENWNAKSHNEFPMLLGKVLMDDMRFGLDENGQRRDTKTIGYLEGLFERYEAIDEEEGLHDPSDKFERGFFDDTMRESRPVNEKASKTVFDGALGNLNKELKALAKQYYLPAALLTLRGKKVKGLPSAVIGLEFNPDRIELRDD